MPVIQSEIDVHGEAFAANREAMLAAVASFREVEQKVLDKANEAKPKFEKRGQLLPRERINLLLDLVGQLLAAQVPRPVPALVRFNALGALWKSANPPRVGQQGLLEIWLRDSLPQPLALIANVTHVAADGHVKATFVPPGEATADLLEKLAFRRHRRQVAGSRQPRRPGNETAITRVLR